MIVTSANFRIFNNIYQKSNFKHPQKNIVDNLSIFFFLKFQYFTTLYILLNITFLNYMLLLLKQLFDYHSH